MNHRNILFRIFCAVFMLAFATGCNIDDAEDIALVKLGSTEKEYIVDADYNEFEIEIYANDRFHIERVNEAGWLTLKTGDITDGKAVISAACEPNKEFKRKAGFVLCSDVDSRRDTVYVKQKATLEAKLEFSAASITLPGAGGESSFNVDTNVPFKDMDVNIDYGEGNEGGWIDKVAIDDSDKTLHIVTRPNTDEQAPKVATINVSFTDGWEETVAIEVNILQRTAKETLGREISFSEFRDKYSLGKKIEDYVILEGIVVSNKKGGNAGDNIQQTVSSIDYTIAPRTVYIESLDGKYGVSALAETEGDNVFDQFDHVKLLIRGAVGKMVPEPDRYELTGVTKTMVVERTSGQASDLPVKEKHINELTDDDIYTFVKLKDVEFPVRKGSLVSINEGYASSTNAHRFSKAPLLVRDINGSSMYLVTNTTCVYRRDGSRLPYGSGNISGVIVHERFPRYDWRNGADPTEVEDDYTLGNIGRYQIRHQNRSDVWGEMNDSVEDSFSALLAEYRFWNPDETAMVCRPSYGNNGWLDHTYSTKFTGSEKLDWHMNTYRQHMFGSETYDYLGPIGTNEKYLFGKNFGNKNGIGIILDPAKEHWSQKMNDLVSHNPDGTLEWCGPYATNKSAAGNGPGGWPGNDAISTTSPQINYSGSAGGRGRGKVPALCFVSWGNNFWWNDETKRFYSWLINFSTEGISTDHLSMQFTVLNPQQSLFSPRYWTAEWSYTESQDPKDDAQWHKIGDYTVPDVSIWANTLYSSSVSYKSIDFELPLEILGHPNVYIRLHPINDICSDGSDYANAVLSGSKSGAALSTEHASNLGYFAIRYNK